MFNLPLIVSHMLCVLLSRTGSERNQSSSTRRRRRPSRGFVLGSELAAGMLLPLEARLLLTGGTLQVTVAGQDNPNDPVPGTLRYEKRVADAMAAQGIYYNLQLDVSPVVIEPIYITIPITIYGQYDGQNSTITDTSAQPDAIVGQDGVTFTNVNLVTQGGPAITATGQLTVENSSTNGPIVSDTTVGCTVTVTNTTFANIPASDGTAASFNESTADQVVFTNNQMTGNADQLFACTVPSAGQLTFSGNTITGNNVATTAAGMTFNGPANITNNLVNYNTFTGPIAGWVAGAGETDNINTNYINENHSGTDATAVGGALVVQNNGGAIAIENTTASFNTVVGDALFYVQGSLSATTAFVDMAIVDNTCGGLYAAIPISLENSVFCDNAGFGGIDADLVDNDLGGSGYIDVGVLTGNPGGYPPHSTNFNPQVEGLLNGRTLEVAFTSPLATFGSAPESGQEYLGFDTTFI